MGNPMYHKLSFKIQASGGAFFVCSVRPAGLLREPTVSEGRGDAGSTGPAQDAPSRRRGSGFSSSKQLEYLNAQMSHERSDSKTRRSCWGNSADGAAQRHLRGVENGVT
eukprot:IDg6498t1